MLTSLPGFSATVVETNQRLEISVGPGAGGGGVVSRCVVGGDFDVQVDFSLLSWPPFNSHSVRLGAMDLGVGSFGAVGMNRSSLEIEKYLMTFTDGVAQVATSETTGRLRIVRAGSALSGYFHNGSDWILVWSGASSAGPTRFNLDVGTRYPTAPGGIVVAFDNFQVNAGTINCPELSLPRISLGAGVQTTASLNVRAGPSVGQPSNGTQPPGALGTVIGGPVAASDGFIWWQIDYENLPDGWSVEDFLIVVIQ